MSVVRLFEINESPVSAVWAVEFRLWLAWRYLEAFSYPSL